MAGTILSGMRPTGRLHLGNYFGALENWVRLQDQYNCYFFVADWHALTTGYDSTEVIIPNTYEMVADFLAAGLDPEKCAIFRQSDVKEHAELHLLMSMITPLSWLERCPTYKDMIQQLSNKDINSYGFLGYPALMSCDILMYKADAVPVGEDQLPHLEFTREMVRRFNHLYGPVFPEPKALMTEAKVLPGTDGRKMSKSYNNTIALADDPDTVRTKVMSMITDASRIKKTDPGHPDICSVYAYHKVFNPEQVPEITEQCKGGCIGCVQCKKALAAKISEYLTPIYERRQAIVADKGYIDDVLEAGRIKAAARAAATMDDVRSAMHFK
ncbi:MAG: tryptophan--tRNA ligase [Clostridia bacterium]|nr:tryptophan--tRNA ligase [Clostridia bacterium]